MSVIDYILHKLYLFWVYCFYVVRPFIRGIVLSASYRYLAALQHVCMCVCVCVFRGGDI